MSNITNIKQQAAENFAAQFPKPAQRGIDEPTWNALCDTIYPGANPDSIIMAIDYCKARGFDVMLKPVHLVPMQVTEAKTKEKVWRDVPMPGIGMYRIQADRSGNYAGADEPEFGPDVIEEFPDPYNSSAKIKVTYPQWCKYTVYKVVNGQRVAFHALERWKENYATQSSKTDCPNSMWRKRPYAQLAKCTEAQALRKAWPEIGSEPTAEEMEGKEIVLNEIPISASEQPQTSRALDAIRGKSSSPVTIDQAPPSDAAVEHQVSSSTKQDIGVTFGQFADALEEAETIEQLAGIWKSASKWGQSTGNEKLLSDLTTIKDERKAQLSAA